MSISSPNSIEQILPQKKLEHFCNDPRPGEKPVFCVAEDIAIGFQKATGFRTLTDVPHHAHLEHPSKLFSA